MTPTPSIPHPLIVYHTHSQYTTPTHSISNTHFTASHIKRGYTFLVHNSSSLKWRSSCTRLFATPGSHIDPLVCDCFHKYTVYSYRRSEGPTCSLQNGTEYPIRPMRMLSDVSDLGGLVPTMGAMNPNPNPLGCKRYLSSNAIGPIPATQTLWVAIPIAKTLSLTYVPGSHFPVRWLHSMVPSL